MANIAFTLISLVIIGIAAFTNNNSKHVLSDQTTSINSVESTSVPVESANKDSLPISFIDKWSFPVSSSSSELAHDELYLTSSADVIQILDWYKNKLDEEDFKLTSLITSKTSDQNVSKIVAQKDSQILTIQIVHKEHSPFSEIKITPNFF